MVGTALHEWESVLSSSTSAGRVSSYRWRRRSGPAQNDGL